MSKRIIISGGGAVSGSRADYISKSKISEEEKNERRLFNSIDAGLTRHKASMFLCGNDKPRNGELTELVFSLERKDFRNFGKTLEEQKEALQEVVREGLENLWKELGVKNVRYVAGIHLNTNNPHAHIVFMPDAFDRETGEPRNIPKIPRSWFWRNDGENSKLAKLFESSVVSHTMATPPQSVLTKLPEENLFLPAREFNDDRIEKTLNRLSEVNNISPHWVEHLTDNRSLYVSRQGALIFIRRDVEGKPTGYIYPQGYQPNDEKGFFYIGNPKTATKFIIVENPKEALAALELSGHRDLSEVCFVASDKQKSPVAFTNFLRERSNETAIRVIWAMGLSRDNVQDQTHYEELQVSVLENRNDKAPTLEFFTWAPKQGFGRDWSNQLSFRNLPGELNGIIKKVLVADEQIAEALDNELTESYQAKVEETFRAVEIENVDDVFIVFEKTESGKGIEYGRYRQNAEELEAGIFTLISVKGETIESQLVADELEAINTITNLFVDKLEQEFIEAEAATVETESAQLSEASSDAEAAADVLDQQLSPDELLELAKQTTARLKEIPLEDVMPRLGLSLTYDRERREYAYTDNGKLFKIKIKGDLFCDRYDDDRGGRNPINLVMHVEGKSFADARQFLLDNFGTEYVPQQTQEKAIVREENAKSKQVFVMPEPNDNKLAHIYDYLTEERAISDVIVNGMIERGFLFANNFGSPVFVNKDENENVKGASWRATIGTKRGDYAGSEKVDAWFYIGDLKTAKKFIIVESPIEAMSYFQLHQDSIDLETTAVISTATNSVPLSLVRLLENNAGADGELVIAYNNDARGQDGAFYLLEKIGQLSMLKHKEHFKNGLIETTEFAGKVYLDVPQLDDWNEDLKAARETERYEADRDHIAAEMETESRPELPEQTQEIITLESFKIVSMEGRTKNLDGSDRVFPISFDTITDFDNYIKSEKPSSGSYKTDVVFSLSDNSSVEQTFLIGNDLPDTFEGLLKNEIKKLETMKNLDTYKDEVEAIENEIGGYKYIINAVQTIQVEESKQIAREENPAILEAEAKADYYEADLIKSVKVSVPQHLQEFGKAEILLARDNPSDKAFHVGYRFTIGGKVYESLPDRSQESFAQGKQSLSVGHELLHDAIHSYWKDNGEPQFTKAETFIEPSEDKFLAYILHKSEISAREFYVRSFEPSFSIKPELNEAEILMLRKWRELTTEGEYFKIENIFAGAAIEANPKRNLMYKLVSEGLIQTEQDGVNTLVKGFQPLTPEALTLIGKKSFSQILKSSDDILRESLNKKLELYSGKLQDNRLHENDRLFYGQQYQKIQTELQELDAKKEAAEDQLLEINAPEATETVKEIVFGINPGEDYELLVENPLKGVYDLKAHKIHQAFRETYITDVENAIGVAFAYRNRTVTLIGADDQGNLQVNFRAEGTANQGKTQGYVLNQLIGEGILSKEDFERLVNISRTKQEIRAELMNKNLHTEYFPEYASDLIYPDSAGFRINSRQSEGDYVLFRNLENNQIVFSKFKIDNNGGQKIYSFDDTEKREFANVAAAIEHLKAREKFFAEDKSLLSEAVAVQEDAPAKNNQAVLVPFNQEGRIEKRIAKILHSHNLAAEIANAEEGFYVRLANEPYMDLHISRDYGTNLIRFTHYYEQNGDLMHDGEMNFRLDDAGRLTLNQIAVGWYGTPRYAYDRSFANMFSKNLIDQGFETAKLVRPHDEFETRNEEIQEPASELKELSAFKEFHLPEAWKEVDHFGATGEIHINAEDKDAYARKVFDLAETFFNENKGVYTENQINAFVLENSIITEGEFYIHFERALELIDITYREQQLEAQSLEEFTSHFTQISEEQFRNEARNPELPNTKEVENILDPEARTGRAVKVIEIQNPAGVKSWLADEFWNGSDITKAEMLTDGLKETGRTATIYTNADWTNLQLIDEAANAQLKKPETAQEKIDNFVKFLKAEYPDLGFSAGYIGNYTPSGDEARYSVFTKIEYKGQWGTQYTSFGSYGSYDELAKAVFETKEFDEFLYYWQKTGEFQSNVEVINTLDRMVSTGDKPLARYLSGETKPRRVYSDEERAVFFEQFKTTFDDQKAQKILEIVGNLKDRQANVWDLSKVSDGISNFDIERAERSGLITVQKVNPIPQENRVELTEKGKVVFEYLDSREIPENWKVDQDMLAIAQMASRVQAALDEKFAGREIENPWLAKPDFDENLVAIGQKGSLNPNEINGYPEFAVWQLERENAWKMSIGKTTPATREDPEDFQFEAVNMRFSFDGVINELFDKHLLEGTNLSANRIAPETRYKLALEVEPAGVKKGTISLANEVRELLHEGKSIGNNVAFNKMCETHFGGTRAAGTFDARDAYDALELGVNVYLLDQGKAFLDRNPQEVMTELRQLLRRLPTQTDRTEEQQLFQQFSTVPTESYAAFAATGMKIGDVVLEPSAGNAGLAIWAKLSGLETHVNELSDRRAGILKIIGFNSIHRQDAQFLNDTLDQSIKPSVILMNPPFSSTGGRTRNRTKYGAEHITDALLRLQDGGRLVAIVGEGMAFDKPTFTNWWSDVMNKYNVRANLSVPGDEYAKFGTTFGNQIIVIDKTGATPGETMQEQLENVIKGDFKNMEAVLEVTRKIGAERIIPEVEEINTFFQGEKAKDLLRVGEILKQGYEPSSDEKEVLERLSKSLATGSGLSVEEVQKRAVETYQAESEKKNVTEFKIGEKDLIDFYANEKGYELKTITGEIERIGMKPALDGSKDKFLNVYVKNEQGVTYMFAIGNRAIDKNAAPLFEAITNGTVKKGDKLTFNGYIYQSLEAKAIKNLAEFPAEVLAGDKKAKVNAYALDVIHEPKPVEKVDATKADILPNLVDANTRNLYEKARWEGIGIATGARIERIEERGYRVIFGEAKGETRYDIAGIIGPATDRFIENGLTIEKVKFTNFEILEKITRSEVKANPDKIYLFGDNLKQTGFGGQAREMRGEENAIGIPTKKEPNREDWAFFKDSEIDNNKTAIDKAFAKLAKYTPDTVIVFPKAGIGTGLAELESRAPETFAYLQDKLNAIGLTEEIRSRDINQSRQTAQKTERQAVEVGSTQETVAMQMDLLKSLPFEERELEINNPLETIDFYEAGILESKGAQGFSEFHNTEMEADWEESQVKTLVLNDFKKVELIETIKLFSEVSNPVEFVIDGERFTLLDKEGANKVENIIGALSSETVTKDETPAPSDENRAKYLEEVAERKTKSYSETAKVLNHYLDEQGRRDIVPEVFVEVADDTVTARIDVYKIDTVNGDRSLIGEITQGTDQYQYAIGDDHNEVYDVEVLSKNLIEAVNTYSVNELNLIPPIDIKAWEKATSEDPNYDEFEDNFPPEHVRAEYFQETMNLAASVKHLTEAVKEKPSTKKGEAALKKNREKLEENISNLSVHVDYTGHYFGEASENYLKKELEAQNITIDDDYKVIVKEDAAKKAEQEKQPVKQQSLFDTDEPKAAETVEAIPTAETVKTENAATAENASEETAKLPEGFRYLTAEEKASLLPHEKGKLVFGETTSIVKDAEVGTKWLNAYDGNVYEVISLVKEKYTQVAYVKDQDGNIDKEPTAGGYSRPIFIPVGDSQTATAAVKEESLDEMIGVGKNTAKRERIDNLGVVGYKPAKLTKGVDHPGDIVESASMAAVDPPDIKYTPKLNKKIISDGKLSSLQLEAVIYAGQRHEHRLPNGMRAGVFIGDGTGVGKGRELAGIAVDNWNQGRKRVLWLSINYDLVPSTKRDLDDLMANNIPLNSLDKHSIHDNLNDTVGDSVLFASYATLIGKGKDEKTRFDQIVKWLGDDGVIMFDEGHLAKNAVSFGMGEASQRGEAVVELQIGKKSSPDWRIVYSSATGATELANMGYMERLGLWGEGTGFPGGFVEFHNTIDKGGIGAMEMVARDMKAAGMYMSRSLSFRGVDYRQVHHELTDDQKEIYNLSSRAWSQVVVQFDDALKQTNANSKTRMMANARLWSGQQMFYRQLMTALKVPAVIRETERVLEKGSEYTDPQTGAKMTKPAQIVIGVIGTGEARTKDQVSKAMQMGLDLDSLDFSPKNILMNVVESAFPTKRFTEQLDPASGKTIKVPVVDKNGKHLESQEALMMRDALLAELNEKVTLPDNPLDQIVNYFGENSVAEITGRKRRIIIDPNTGERSYVKRAREGVAMDKASQDEMNAFQAGRKRIAIISQSASTGISLHADQRSDSSDFRRVHITLETSWSADVQMQTFGRTHRSNQSMPPEYVLMSTDLGGEKRFLSTIAKRLSSLGALTKGDREQAGGGNLLQYDFENKYGVEAAKKIVAQLRDDKASLMTTLPPDPATGEERSGLRMLYTMGLARKDGNAYTVTEETMKNLEVSRFLNRVLMLDVDTQNAVFDAFVSEMETIIQHDKDLGLFDEGVQDIEGENIRFAAEPRIVATDKSTGAHTYHNQIHADIPTHPVTLREIAERNQVVRLNGIEVAESKNKGVFYQQTNSKNIVYVEYASSRPNPKTGSMEKFYKYARPTGWQSSLLHESELIGKFTPVQLDQNLTFKDDTQMTAKDWWNKTVVETPKTQVHTYHLISGAVLPVWQRLSSSNEAGNQMSLKTVRIETQEGERIVGVQIPTNHINRVLRDLGVEQSYKTPEEVFDAVVDTKETIDLVAGIKLKPEFLKKQPAIRIVNLTQSQEREFYNFGALQERPGFSEIKYFVPTDREKGIEVLTKILERYPAVDTQEKQTVKDKTETAATTSAGFAEALDDAVKIFSGKNGLGEGLLAKIGDKNSPFAQKAAALENQPISKYWWMMKAEVNDNGQVLLNPASYEFARATYKESMGYQVEQFDGLFNDELVTERFFDALHRKGTEGGIYAESIRSLTKTMEKGREINGHGILVLLADESASMHEDLHVASHVASLGKSLEERHARFDELKNHESYLLAKDTLIGLHKTNADGLLVEELFVECASGKADKFGLLPDEAAEFTELWFRSFAEKNGIISKEQFKEMTDESKEIRDRAYGIIAEQIGRNAVESSGIERAGESLGEFSNGNVEARSNQPQSGNGNGVEKLQNIPFELAQNARAEQNHRNQEILNRALENGDSVKAGMLYKPAEEDDSIADQSVIKPGDVISEKFQNILMDSGLEKLLESNEAVVKFETVGKEPIHFQMEIADNLIKFTEMESTPDGKGLQDNRGIYFKKDESGELTYELDFEREIGTNNIKQRHDEVNGSFTVNVWKMDKLGENIIVKEIEIEPEIALHVESVNDRNLEKSHAEQLGVQIISDARLNEAEAALTKFEREKKDVKFTAKIDKDDAEELRTVSLSELEGERKAFARTQVQDDKKTGILAMIAEDERKPIEEIEKLAYIKAFRKAESEQTPWIKAVESEIGKEREVLTEKIRQASESRESVLKDTQAIIAQNSNRENVKPILPIEAVWSEQIKAAQRGDVEIFTKLEEIHQEQNVPRPNDVYARLRGVEMMTGLIARQEDKKLIEWLDKDENQKRIVVEIKPEDSELKVQNHRIEDVKVKHQELVADYHDAAKQAENERKQASRAAFQPIMNKINPFSVAQGQLSWFTQPMETLNRHINPIEIIKNDPGVQIIRAVANYFDHRSNAKAMEKIAQEAFNQAQVLKQQFAPEVAENANKIADAVREAVGREEILRNDLKQNPMSDQELLKTPERALTDAEMKQIGDASAKLGDSELLDKFNNILEKDASLAENIGATAERIVASSLLSQARAASASTQAIESISLTEAGTMEVEINPARFIEAKNQIETSEIAEGFQNRMIDEQISVPRLNLEETQEAESLMSSLNNQSELSEYIGNQYSQAGNGMAKAMQQELTETEQLLLKQMTLPNEVVQRFEQIAQSELTTEKLYQQAEQAIANNVPFQNTGQTFQTVNPGDMQEAAAREFWKNDRQLRESQLNQDGLNKTKTMEAEAETLAEAETVETVEAAEAAEEALLILGA